MLDLMVIEIYVAGRIVKKVYRDSDTKIFLVLDEI